MRAILEKVKHGDMRPLRVPLIPPITPHPAYPHLSFDDYMADPLFCKMNLEYVERDDPLRVIMPEDPNGHYPDPDPVPDPDPTVLWPYCGPTLILT